MEKYIRVFVFLLIPLFGCTKLKHFPQLVTLKKYSDEQDATDLYVDSQEENFRLMKEEMERGVFGQYTDKTQVEKIFGEPLFAKTGMFEGANAEIWMYRRPVNYGDSDKAYLYFDDKGQLKTYELQRFKE
jgi:hypothetical protein